MTRASDVIETFSPHSSWNSLKSWDHYFDTIKPWLDEQSASGKEVLPRRADQFNAFHLGVDDIKVVILGQDPYPTKGHSHGLAFSTFPHVTPLPHSLRNIYTEATEDLGDWFRPRSGDLRQWSSRGVFLLNTALTVEEGKPGSHIDIWRKFTYETLSRVSRSRSPVAWLLWGKRAQEYQGMVPDHHLVLCAGHPSPLSYRLFRGCKHFSKAAEFLKINPRDLWSLEDD